MGCKGCAGVLPMSLLQNLKELGLSLPPDVIQCRLEKYAVHSPDITISISNPDTDSTIASIYRGGGPRISNYNARISFDGWLLRETTKRQVHLEKAAVTGVFLDGNAAIEVNGTKLEFDLVAFAPGVNAAGIPVHGLNYIPPRTVRMAQQELYAGKEEIEAKLGNAAYAFIIPDLNMVFGTLVPKGPFINVSVLSRRKHPVSVADFLNHSLVKEMLPSQYP